MAEQYFATKEADELYPDLQKLKEKFYQYLRTSTFIELYRRSYYQFYKANIHMGDLASIGENGEYSGLYVNDFKNLLTQLVNLTVSQRPAFQARATNTDYKSQSQAKLANGLLDYYMREKRLEKFIKKAVESAVIFGRGFVSINWNTDLGDDYGVDEKGEIKKNGDIEFRTHNPVDVIRDPVSKSFDTCDWYIIRTYQNKYNLSAKFSAYKDEIENLTYTVKDKLDDIFDFNLVNQFYQNTDLIPVYEFYHKKTSALMEGRYVLYLEGGTILIDSPLPFKDIPIYSVSTGEIQNTSFDYTVAFDLLPIQKYMDQLTSTMVTNQSQFGVQNILMPRGSNIGIEELTGGLNVIEYDANLGVPQAWAPVSTPPELFNMLQLLQQKSQTLSGINNVLLGQPDPSLKSGSALALIASQAYQSNLPLQASYVQLIEDIGTGIINVLKDFASAPRIAMITGINNRSYMKEFTGDDLSQINRVIVDIGNPITNTQAGRLELATNLINMPPEFRDSYYQILQTGRYENVMEGDSAELMLIKSENEKIQNGEKVTAIITDNHQLHIREHKPVLSSPESRDNPQVVQTDLEHIQQHIDLLKNGDPDILHATGSQPIAKQAPPVQQASQAQPAILNKAASVNMPSMPNNPMTNSKFTPPQVQ